MSVKLGGYMFEHACYDHEVDVLYMRNGPSSDATDFGESPEGHHLRFAPDGTLLGITLVNPRWLLEQDGKIVVTLPDGSRLETADLGPALAAA
ncbi:DUF2283 domain-containing protein [Gaiella sp.]|jgi:hypothetical protein|uniref:DUF2283 domain-containing protein n=1 Tax=Gaiella sp. TaxID=2663207 RepID=UPI002E336A31|nr:DUF2283 domain-containing protein [Gaiella sp.]HEX5584124.1 DUF2283 domain-containing protein [Gaiella sp.]